MTTLAVRLPPGREVGPDSLQDLLPDMEVSLQWAPNGWLTLTFDRDLSNEETQAVMCRLRSSTPQEEAARCALADALPVLTAWTPGPLSPDAAQLQRLTDAVAMLAALALGDLGTEEP